VIQFAQSASDAQLDAIEAAHRDIVRRALRGASPAVLSAAQAVDWGLHDTMIDALGNELVSSTYRVNSLRIRLIRLERVTLDADALLPAMDEHLRLIAALRTRDPQRAVATLEAHLTHARNRALGF
jgi:DNA-binding GntR family transcriptional regulator